ncbi:MAG TPA: tetratricopeptide repeat protein [Opitutaceae bacterium]
MESSSAFRPAKPAWADAEAALAACLILGLVLLAYLPALSGGMLWDDDAHVTKLQLRSLHGLWRIWFDVGATQQYYPLLHSAFWVEHRLWGDSVAGYHLANVVLHAAAAWLLFTLLRVLSFPAPWLAALIFALHPVCVESVAWISEQKNTLSAVFYLVSAILYLRFDATRRRNLYSWALALFVMALLTKTVTATLPAALLVILWWKRGRLDFSRDALPLAPWFVLAAASGLFTAWAEKNFIGAQGSDFAFSFAERLQLSGRVVVFYARQLAWPDNLMFIYPRWELSAGDVAKWAPLGAVALAIGICLFVSRRYRGPLAALLFFVGTLFPALGFVDVYPFRFSFVADHFQYLASIGLILLAAWALGLAARRLGSGAWVLLGVPVFLGFLSWRQARVYGDSATLYRSTLAANPSAWLMHYNLAVDLGLKPEHIDEAIEEYRATIRLKPDHWEAHNNLASALLKRPGHASEAIAEFEAAIRYNPGYAAAENNLGVALEEFPERMEEAKQHFRAAIRIRPDYDAAHSNLGSLLLGQRVSIEDAASEFEAAIRIAPTVADYHYGLANALSLLPGRLPDAVAEYRTALRLRPDYAEAHSNLGVALAHMPGHVDEAISEYRAALALDPKGAQIHANLANTLARLPGRKDEAADEYRAALRIEPADAEAHYGLGLILAARKGGVAEATAEFGAAVRLRPDFAEARFCLGVSLAMAGNRAAAQEQLEAALQIRPDFELARKALARVKALKP